MPGKGSAGRSAPSAESSEQVVDRILAAAQEEFELVGIRRSSMSDIAKRARLGRATVYRHFPGKENLVEAIGGREMMAVFGRVDAALANSENAADAVVQLAVVSARELRENRLLNKLLATEPEEVYSYAATSGGAALAVARVFLVQHLGTLAAPDLPDDAHLEKAAEIMVRLAATQLLIPDGVIPYRDDTAVADFARQFFVPIVTGKMAQSVES
ncbi:helix-turn-helix domain-containing protein [Nocardia sp. NPDC051756]|uniref:TetR/AcrR family transcriptional regulator n=1 Tax=Nocardia sp. NPDC051756 TaxID=3154751 RepID=UPI0034125B3C